jgi:hypothetical protein
MVAPTDIDNDIDYYGSTVILTVKSGILYDDWGNEYYDETTISTVAVPNDITGGEEYNTEGVFVPGDKVFFFKSTESYLENGNTVTFGSNTYRITEIVSHNLQNKQFPYEVRCKKI